MTRPENIRQRLRSVRRSELLNDMVRGLCMAATVSASAMLVLVLLETFLHGSIQLRTIMWYAWMVVSGGALGGYVGPSALKFFALGTSASIDDVALRVGRAYNDLGDKLLNALQLDAQPALATSS